MKNPFKTGLYILFVLIIFLNQQCSSSKKNSLRTADLSLKLRYAKSYEKEQIQRNIETGMKWTLSYLGAALPKGTWEEVLVWEADSTAFQLNMDKAGFNAKAESALAQLVQKFKSSDEYLKMKGIDLGRFIALTINSSNHYFAITGVPKTIEDFKERFVFEDEMFGMLSEESTIGIGERLVGSCNLDSAENVMDLGFFGFEGTGSVLEKGLIPGDFETIDIMPNGQIRVGIYDHHGELAPAANPELTLAGKVAKCLWCHEMRFLPTFRSASKIEGLMSEKDFVEIVDSSNSRLTKYRSGLETDINYSDRAAHAQVEILYISFMEPSAERLAREWGMEISEVKQKLAGFETHVHHEFPFIGESYNRAEVEAFAPYGSVRPPGSARELSGYEPDLLND